MFWSTTRPIHLEVIQDIYTSEEMTFTKYQATIYLLYKKGVREDIKNWRPISLLNNDYKIITKKFIKPAQISYRRNNPWRPEGVHTWAE